MRARPAAIPAFAAALLAAALIAGCGGVSLDEPIEGPVWRLSRLGGDPVAEGGNPRGDPQIRFDGRSGRVFGSGGCNQVSGSFERNGNSLRMSQLASTRTACPDPALNAKESQFFAALQATAGYRLQGPTQLSLLDASGNTIATLSAR